MNKLTPSLMKIHDNIKLIMPKSNYKARHPHLIAKQSNLKI